MAEKIVASVLVAKERLEMQEFTFPTIGSDDGLLRVEACGLCGADVEQFRGESGHTHFPFIPGHEPVGVIAEIGVNARRRWNVKVGDRVVVEPKIPCYFCEHCRDGNYIACVPYDRGPSAYSMTSTTVAPGLYGAYSQYMYLHPNARVHRISAEVAPEMAALFNPIANGIAWASIAPDTKRGSTVLILGGGQRGLACVLAARLSGAEQVIVTDLSGASRKLALAVELGADHTIRSDAESVPERVRELTAGRLADVVVDTSAGATAPVLDALEAVRVGGTVVLGGLKNGRVTEGFVSDRVVHKQITIKGVVSAPSAAFAEAVRLIERREGALGTMHTHTFALSEASRAVRTLAREVPGEDPVHITVEPWR